MRSYLEVVLALIFHRFKTPSNLKSWALAYTKMQFSTFSVCYLKFVLGLDFGPQMAPKIESKSLQNPFGNEVEILVKLNDDFEPNLEANLGPKRPQNFQNNSKKSSKKRSKITLSKKHLAKTSKISKMTSTWAQKLPRESILIDFGIDFDRFLILFVLIVWSSFNESSLAGACTLKVPRWLSSLPKPITNDAKNSRVPHRWSRPSNHEVKRLYQGIRAMQKTLKSQKSCKVPLQPKRKKPGRCGGVARAS